MRVCSIVNVRVSCVFGLIIFGVTRVTIAMPTPKSLLLKPPGTT